MTQNENHTRPYTHPYGWTLTTLGKATALNPRSFTMPPQDNDLVSFVPMAAVEAESGRMDVSQQRRWKDVKKGYTPFQDDDVLFAKITPCMENGKVAVAAGMKGGRGAGSTEFHVLRSLGATEPKFVMYFLLQESFRVAARLKMKGTAGQLRVPTDFMESADFPLPPRPEQRQIVADIEKQFTRLEAGVSGLRRVQANLKRYRAAVLKAACEGKLVPIEAELARKEGHAYETGADLLARLLTERRQKWTGRGKYKEPATPDTTKLPPLPEGWVWATVEQLSVVVRGASPRPAGDPKYFGGPIPWITVGPITVDQNPYLRVVPGTVTEAGRERSRYVEPQTLLLTNSGATLGVPRITLIGGCINDGVAALLDVDYPLKLYLVYFLHSQTTRLRGVNQGAAQPNLNTSIIKAINVPLPPLAEQERIVAEVERRLRVMEELEAVVSANLQRGSRFRQSILQRAFSGQLVNTWI